MMLVKKQKCNTIYIKEYMKKVNIVCEYNFEEVTKPFLSVEIEQNNNRVAIHDKLKGLLYQR